MAEIMSSTIREKGSRAKAKKLSTRVDLTPMVDLGFLLITFFIFTTALSNPTVMRLTMPDDRPVDKPVLTSEEKTLTLILGGSNHLYYYAGQFAGTVEGTNFKALRDLIRSKKELVSQKFGSSKIVVLIKVTPESNYKEIVDTLDEMVISDVATYMLLEPEQAELQAVAAVD